MNYVYNVNVYTRMRQQSRRETHGVAAERGRHVQILRSSIRPLHVQLSVWRAPEIVSSGNLENWFMISHSFRWVSVHSIKADGWEDRWKERWQRRTVAGAGRAGKNSSGKLIFLIRKKDIFLLLFVRGGGGGWIHARWNHEIIRSIPWTGSERDYEKKVKQKTKYIKIYTIIEEKKRN